MTTEADQSGADESQETASEDAAIEQSGAQSASREAAKYRRRLRETEAERDEKVAALEAERDQALARANAIERREVERIVTGEGGLANAADFWLAGIDLDSLRDDHGAIDEPKVEAARSQVLSEHPNWRHQPTPDFDAGVREPIDEPRGPSFGQAMKRAVTG